MVKTPGPSQFRKIILALLKGNLSRLEVSTWQAAVVAETGWRMPLSTRQGYWYFYSLAHLLAEDYRGRPLLRDQDIKEYLADLEAVPGTLVKNGITQLRSHQLQPGRLQWPLMSCVIEAIDIETVTGFPSVRGVFENSDEMVQHCHLRFETDDYLLVKHLAADDPEMFVLGSQRDPQKLDRFIKALGR